MSTRRRIETRVRAATTVTVVSDRVAEPCATRDLGRGGMFLLTNARWPVGKELRLLLSHRHGELHIPARVAHVQEDGVGVEFLTVDRRARKTIQVLISDLLADGAWLDERRRSLRTEIEGPVVWRQGSLLLNGALRDLSGTGAFVETPHPSPMQSKICLYLPSCQGSPRPNQAEGCEAEVIRRDRDGFALRFSRPSAAFHTALEKVLEAAQRRQRINPQGKKLE